jgi:hypothetical protein
VELKPKSTDSEPSKLERIVGGRLEEILEPGEAVLGIAAASQQKGVFSGGVVALVVTDRRLVVQPLDRRGKGPKGEPTSITSEQVASVRLGRPGGGWDSPGSVIVGRSSVQVKLKTTDGGRFRFMLMDGGGPFGSLGGGADQAAGAQAVLAFFDPGQAARI